MTYSSGETMPSSSASMTASYELAQPLEKRLVRAHLL